MMGPHGLGRSKLFFATCASDNCCAHDFTDLNRGKPHATRGAQNQQCFTGLQMRTMIQRQVAGAIGDLKSGGIHEIHLVR